MKLLSVLTEFFINAFQITRPPPEQQRRIEWILGGLMLLTLLLVTALAAGLLVWSFHG